MRTTYTDGGPQNSYFLRCSRFFLICVFVTVFVAQVHLGLTASCLSLPRAETTDTYRHGWLHYRFFLIGVQQRLMFMERGVKFQHTHTSCNIHIWAFSIDVTSHTCHFLWQGH